MITGRCERAGCTCPAFRVPVLEAVTLALCPGCLEELGEDGQRFEEVVDERSHKIRAYEAYKAALHGGIGSLVDALRAAREIKEADQALRAAIRSWAKDFPVRHRHQAPETTAPESKPS